ncbi:helix-turn-helix domain-containing protein [Streptomyces sp. NPDC091272]|uniref:helix-turn-helix domain-containing protein n=1 Tax=Streptomyces sp. NPDC091272 TaxID=3365981 RepID=UPI00382C8C07
MARGRGRPARHSGERLLTVEEVAAWLRVSESSVRNKYRAWGIKPQKVGRLLRFRERDIAHYLDEHYG